MPDTNSTTSLTKSEAKPSFEQVREAILDAEPTLLTLAHMDIEWVMENGKENKTYTQWVAECIRDGAKARKRTVEYGVKVRKLKAEDEARAANMDNFAKYLLSNPTMIMEAKAGNPAKMLQVGASFKIPINEILQYLVPAPAAPATAEPVKDPNPAQ